MNQVRTTERTTVNTAVLKIASGRSMVASPLEAGIPTADANIASCRHSYGMTMPLELLAVKEQSHH